MCLVMMAALPCGGVPVRAVVGGAPVAVTAIALDEDTVVGPRHYLDGFPAEGGEGEVNAVVEIPCGTTGKFEVDEDDGWLKWQRDRDHGGRRAIDYLAFPVNYGMVPRTLAPDGDALDIVVLGAGIERGRVARTRVIGVLEMGEPDEHDDKLIAVPAEAELANGFSRLHDLPELDAGYPAVRAILELWFANYWGAGATHVLGWGGAAQAADVLAEAERAYEEGARGCTARPAAAGLRLRARSPFAVHVP
jgi:inorganic pyrophosphatase